MFICTIEKVIIMRNLEVNTKIQILATYKITNA